MKRSARYVIAVFALLASLVFLSPASANHLAIAWDAPATNADGSTLGDLTGYRIYYGLAPTGAYAPPCNSYYIDVPAVTDFHLDGLSDGGLYYVQVTARDSSGMESTCSNEASGVASYVATAVAPPPPAVAPAPPAAVPAPPVYWWLDPNYNPYPHESQ